MSEIPPDLPSSAAQTGVQAREVAKEREARRAGQSDAATRQVKTVDEAGSTVETGDDDVAVFADAEGGGGQGREPEEHGPPEAESADAGAGGGITEGDDGQLHVDLEA
jgi:hypothetical protein